MVNRRQTQGKISIYFPLTAVVWQSLMSLHNNTMRKKRKTIPHFIHAQKEKYSFSERVKLHAIDLTLLSPKSISLSFARSDDYGLLMNQFSSWKQKSTNKSMLFCWFHELKWLSKCHLSTKSYKEMRTAQYARTGVKKRRGLGFHFLTAASCCISSAVTSL